MKGRISLNCITKIINFVDDVIFFLYYNTNKLLKSYGLLVLMFGTYREMGYMTTTYKLLL